MAVIKRSLGKKGEWKARAQRGKVTGEQLLRKVSMGEKVGGWGILVGVWEG